MTCLFVQCRRNSGSFNYWPFRQKREYFQTKNYYQEASFQFNFFLSFIGDFPLSFVLFSSRLSLFLILFSMDVGPFIILFYWIFVNICFLLCITNYKQQTTTNKNNNNYTIISRTTAVADKLWHTKNWYLMNLWY